MNNWQKHANNEEDFLESLKVDFFKDRIFVLTPQNDIIDLPAGATPVDFAYRIHSDVGDNCVGAKVNGKIAPLDYELQTRDVVDIITQKQETFRRLAPVRQNLARQKAHPRSVK